MSTVSFFVILRTWDSDLENKKFFGILSVFMPFSLLKNQNWLTSGLRGMKTKNLHDPNSADLNTSEHKDSEKYPLG